MSTAGLRLAIAAWGCATAIAVLGGCTAPPPPPEYSPAEARQQGLYPSARRWRITSAREAARTLGDVLRYVVPKPIPISGLGIVTGLNRTGDRGPAAAQLRAAWEQMASGDGPLAGVPLPKTPRSAALVVVEAVLPVDGTPGPAWVRPAGSPKNGHARSLEYGRLLATVLRADGAELARAEGPLIFTRVRPDGTTVRDVRAGRVARVVPKRPPDAKRLEFTIDETLPGAATAGLDALRTALRGAKVWMDAGPPRRVFAALTEPMSAAGVRRLLAQPITVPVAEPGVVVIHGGPGKPGRIELLGPPPALGLTNHRIAHRRSVLLSDAAAAQAGETLDPGADGATEGFVRIVGVPTWKGQPFRRALVEFDAADGRRVRVICSNLLSELLPVVDQTGLSLRNLAAALQQAHDAGGLPAPVVVEWAQKPPEKAGAGAGTGGQESRGKGR